MSWSHRPRPPCFISSAMRPAARVDVGIPLSAEVADRPAASEASWWSTCFAHKGGSPDKSRPQDPPFGARHRPWQDTQPGGPTRLALLVGARLPRRGPSWGQLDIKGLESFRVSHFSSFFLPETLSQKVRNARKWVPVFLVPIIFDTRGGLIYCFTLLLALELRPF